MDSPYGLIKQGVQRLFHGGGALADPVEQRKLSGLQTAAVKRLDRLQLLLRQDGMGQQKAFRATVVGLEQMALRA
ncbi:hypothetical protein SDC9_141017 [bioreactor metagenome]|uniref:Uncharacterized protein n=1 Tax=bioreactor metagenome TaxID=1076179 RepID=A0A645DX42_9ZZZZ